MTEQLADYEDGYYAGFAAAEPTLHKPDVLAERARAELFQKRFRVAERKIANARRWLRAKQHVKAYEALGRWPR